MVQELNRDPGTHTPKMSQIPAAESDRRGQSDASAKLRHCSSRTGITSRAAGTGAQALLAARHDKPALILSDIFLPEMDGYAFCKPSKSDDQLKDPR